MPRYTYKVVCGCSHEEAGGYTRETSIERVVPVMEMDSQSCQCCGSLLRRVFNPKDVQICIPVHMMAATEEHFPKDALLPKTPQEIELHRRVDARPADSAEGWC